MNLRQVSGVPDKALNLDRLTDLLGDDRDSIVEILDLAVGTCRKALDTLRSLGPQSPAAAIEHAAHAMKGAAANVGAEALSVVAASLEDQARQAQIADFDASVAQIAKQFELFLTEVRAYEAEAT
ncbi:MAG TPA: Hpt domain-containing protein [Candidatus Acidoferrales bacterium]|nr:Hpt domain-containing protein [Candidatus Acidoferrales bacterium]